MSEIIVHGIPGSPFLRAALATLEEKKAPYRLRAWAPGEHRGEAYRAMHPFSRIPVIQRGDFTLYETQAILRYIDAVCEGPALQPKAPEAAARMNQLLGINDWYFFPQVGTTIVFQRIIGPRFLGLQPDAAVIAAAQPNAERCVRVIDGLLGDQTYLAGEAISLADLVLYPQLYYFGQTPEGTALLDGTKFSGWMRRMAERSSMTATLPPEALRQAA